MSTVNSSSDGCHTAQLSSWTWQWVHWSPMVRLPWHAMHSTSQRIVLYVWQWTLPPALLEQTKLHLLLPWWPRVLPNNFRITILLTKNKTLWEFETTSVYSFRYTSSSPVFFQNSESMLKPQIEFKYVTGETIAWPGVYTKVQQLVPKSLQCHFCWIVNPTSSRFLYSAQTHSKMVL